MTTRISDQSPRMSAPDDLTCHGPDEPRESRVDAPATGACKTVVSSTVAAYAAAAGAAVFKNPMAGVATGLVGKIAGDGVAWLACESPEAK